MQVVYVFLASPGDVPKEREYVRAVIEEANNSTARHKDIALHLVKWEPTRTPESGRTPRR